MKKLISFIFIIALILSISSCKTQEDTDINSFEIFLATTESVRNFGYYDFNNLNLEEIPVLTGEDIRSYFWDRHIIEINGEFSEIIFNRSEEEYADFDIDTNGFRQYEKGGSKILATGQYMCFVVVINGEKIYSGTFPGSSVMPETEEKIIIGDLSDERFAIDFNDTGFDVRNSDKVFDYFEKAGKIDSLMVSNTDLAVEELQAQLDSSEEAYAELEEQYNFLNSLFQSSDTDAYLREALIEWQNKRLQLLGCGGTRLRRR